MRPNTPLATAKPMVSVTASMASAHVRLTMPA
jgi:hypothetical protein